MDQNETIWTRIVQYAYGLKNQNRPIWTKMIQNGPKGIKRGHNDKITKIDVSSHHFILYGSVVKT